MTPNQWLFAVVSTRQEGRIAIVTNAGRDVVDAAASARKVIAGRIFSVSGSRRARRTAPCPAKPLLAKTGGCVRQNRVVLAPVAGVKLSVANSIQPGQVSHQAGSDGDKTNSSPGRARYKP